MQRLRLIKRTRFRAHIIKSSTIRKWVDFQEIARALQKLSKQNVEESMFKERNETEFFAQCIWQSNHEKCKCAYMVEQEERLRLFFDCLEEGKPFSRGNQIIFAMMREMLLNITSVISTRLPHIFMNDMRKQT